MAVYTEVFEDDLEQFVAQYDIGRVVSCKGIAEGVENSNFMLRTETGNYILTLYEKRVNPDDLPFFVGLMGHLAAKGLACPVPVRGNDGNSLRKLCGRPAAIVTFLDGISPRKISVNHCSRLGQALASFHLDGSDFSCSRKNGLDIVAWQYLLGKVSQRADELKTGLGEYIGKELVHLQKNWPSGLPSGVIHADLFPDNVFFIGDDLSGVIDFYFACNDFYAYDLAICINAWCFESDYSFNVTKARQMIGNYHRIRPLSSDEMKNIPILARGSAMRFLLTRLYDWLNTPKGAFVKLKDPLEYEKKLRFHAEASGLQSYGVE